MSDQSFVGGSISATISYLDSELTPTVQFILFRNPIDDSLIRVGLEGGDYEADYQMYGRYVVVLLDNSKQTDKLSLLSKAISLSTQRRKRFT